MRLRATLLSLLLAVSLIGAACSSDDDDEAVDTGDDTEQTEDQVDEEEQDEATADGDLAAVVDGAQLELEDLGEGWELVSDNPPTDDDEEDEPNPIDECATSELQDSFEAAKVAESNERSFRRTGTGPIPAEVQSSSIGLDDETLFEDMHEVLRSPEFGTCLGEGLQTAMAGGGGEAVVGEVEQSDEVVDPGNDDGLQSTGITIPITLTVEGQTFELRATMVFLNSGPVGSSMFAFAPEGEVSSENVAEWGRLLAERIAA
jgi:hypothetical protein